MSIAPATNPPHRSYCRFAEGYKCGCPFTPAKIQLILPHLSEAAFYREEPDPACPILLDDNPKTTIDLDPANKDHVAGVIATRIIRDMSDRRGLAQEWDQIDRDVKLEVFETWKAIVKDVLTPQP